jgi:FkbM family methyltransferase
MDESAAAADPTSMLHRIPLLEAQVAALTAEVLRLRDGQSIYLGDHEALTRLYTGHRMYVDTRDVGICSHLMLEGRWEPWIERVIAEAVKPGMRFCDVGANFGYYTVLGAQWVGPEGRVFAFEANPAICRKLRKSVSINGFDPVVRIFELGVSDTEGVLELAFTHEYSGGGAFGVGDHGYWKTERVRVRTAPIDALLSDIPAVEVMKVDVEGMEAAALRGAAGLIGRSPSLTMVVEFQESGLLEEPGGALAYLAGFVAQGFSIALIEPAGPTPPLAPEDCLARLGGRLGYLFLRRG